MVYILDKDGKEDRLTAGTHFLPRLNPWVSMRVNFYEQRKHDEYKGLHGSDL